MGGRLKTNKPFPHYMDYTTQRMFVSLVLSRAPAYALRRPVHLIAFRRLFTTRQLSQLVLSAPTHVRVSSL